jgi:hypothetical protein
MRASAAGKARVVADRNGRLAERRGAPNHFLRQAGAPQEGKGRTRVKLDK